MIWIVLTTQVILLGAVLLVLRFAERMFSKMAHAFAMSLQTVISPGVKDREAQTEQVTIEAMDEPELPWDHWDSATWISNGAGETTPQPSDETL